VSPSLRSRRLLEPPEKLSIKLFVMSLTEDICKEPNQSIRYLPYSISRIFSVNKQRPKEKFTRVRRSVTWRTLGPRIWDGLRGRVGSGSDLAPMDLRSMLVSSDSTESTTVDASSAKAEWIMMMAFNWSMSPKHQPLLLRVSRIFDSESEVELSSISFSFLAPLCVVIMGI
jgi:hypothetical protein